ncbi:hypothetical protein DFJ73DRAFT_851333, partial [Zopfochytrium polystomum]
MWGVLLIVVFWMGSSPSSLASASASAATTSPLSSPLRRRLSLFSPMPLFRMLTTFSSSTTSASAAPIPLAQQQQQQQQPVVIYNVILPDALAATAALLSSSSSSSSSAPASSSPPLIPAFPFSTVNSTNGAAADHPATADALSSSLERQKTDQDLQTLLKTAPATILFGVDSSNGRGPGWDVSLWTAVDDRIRGGSSSSKMDLVTVPVGDDRGVARVAARFSGSLDTETLGTAGFASQRFLPSPEPLDMQRRLPPQIPRESSSSSSPPTAIVLRIIRADARIYSLNVRSVLGRTLPSGRIEAALEYKASFAVDAPLPPPPAASSAAAPVATVVLPFAAFRPYYRGKLVTSGGGGDGEGEGGAEGIKKGPGANREGEAMDWRSVRSLSVMVQSYFGVQTSGPFELVIESIGV